MTTSLQVSGLTKSFGPNTVVDALDLEVQENDFLVLLGPSGCGKTTTLRCLAGLEIPESGRIQFRDWTVFDSHRHVDIPPHKRNIGMVFQSYALWPHMTVRDNIAFPLKERRMKKAAYEGLVEDAAAMVHCDELLDRYPSQLSGGQQQRIALARGLVGQPDLVLLDEPLSNLDARLRDRVRTEIRELHQRLGFTAIMVTHDQSEAFALGTRIAIMRHGKIEQYDTPDRVYLNPANEYVATFIGMSNRIEWRREGENWISVGGARVGQDELEMRPAEQVVSLARPEDFEMHPRQEQVVNRITFSGDFVTAEYGGRHFDVAVEAEDTRFHLRITEADHSWVRDLSPGTPVTVSVSVADLRTFVDDGFTHE